jgi:hypothetical protein
MKTLISSTILLFLIFYFGAPWIIAERRNTVNKKRIKIISIAIPVMGFLGAFMLEPLWLISLCSPPVLILWAIIDKKTGSSDISVGKG